MLLLRTHEARLSQLDDGRRRRLMVGVPLRRTRMIGPLEWPDGKASAEAAAARLQAPPFS